MAFPRGDRAVALSLQLSLAHRELRGRLAAVRADLGRGRFADDALLTHCLAFCSALTRHHEGEDEGLFAALLRERPDLAPTVAKLVEDHGLITTLLSRVRELVDRAASHTAERASGRGAAAPDAEDLAAIGRELDGLAAIMESHFGYEERAIGAALDAGVDDDGWSGPVLRLDVP